MNKYLQMATFILVASLMPAGSLLAELEYDASIVNVPAHQMPFSDLASPEAKAQFAHEHSPAFAASPIADMHKLPIEMQRRILDEHYLEPRVRKALEIYPARIVPDEISGTYVEYIEPVGGIYRPWGQGFDQPPRRGIQHGGAHQWTIGIDTSCSEHRTQGYFSRLSSGARTQFSQRQ